MSNMQVRQPKRATLQPHIHAETRNISFIQTAKDLRDLGIKNNLFFLYLYDINLVNVDPHDPNLTRDQQMAIINECVRNPWYFLRECARISEDGGGGRPYILNRGNLAATFCFLKHIDHYLVLPRQKGKTQSTIAIILWAYTFGTTNTEMMFINKQAADANNNLNRLKQQRDLLPPYLRMKQLITKDGKIDKGKDNVTSLFNPVTRNNIVTKPSAQSTEKAEGLGRGCTQTVQYYDETEFTKHIKTIVEAAGPAFNTASKNAAKNNAAYCRVLTSTPGDLDSEAGQEALQIVNGCAKWTEKMYDWTAEQRRQYIKANGDNGIVYIEYSYQQLGEGEEWFLSACQKVLNNSIKIKREILLQRMHGSNNSPFEPEDLQAIQELRKDVIEEIFINQVCRVDVYKKLDPNKTYLVGVDCSSGIGVDNHALTVIDPFYLTPVAEFKSPYLSVPDLGRFIHVFVQKYIPRAIVCVERNHTGTAVMSFLKETTTGTRLYYEQSKDIQIDSSFDPQGFLKQEAHNRRMLGVWTGSTSRGLMMKLLESLVYEQKDAFVTHNIISNLQGLVKKKNGRIDHQVGGHDDSLMSFLIALYVAHYGKNLSRFGFVKGIGDPEELNQGLLEEATPTINFEQILSESEAAQSFFGNSISYEQNDYDAQILDQMNKERQRSNMLDQQMGMKNIDVYVEVDQFGLPKPYSMDDSLFDELNDI